MSAKTINKRAMLYRQKAASAISEGDRRFYIRMMMHYQRMLKGQ